MPSFGFRHDPLMRLILAVLCCATLSAAAWPELIQAGQTPIALRGSERFSWLWYKVYDVALHLPPTVTREQSLGEVPRRIAFRYLRGFSAEELAKATSKTVAERRGSAPSPEIDAGLAAINALWPTVVTGDELTLTYTPGVGTTVARNGVDLGMVAGATFSSVLFSIWIGDKPIDDDLRDGLLGTK